MALARMHKLPLDPDDWEQVWATLDKYDEPTYVYAIVDHESRLVKFGRSVSPGARLHNLKTANGAELKLWGFCEERPGLCERDVHIEVAEHRVRGEWFDLNDKTQEIINRIRKAAGL